LPPISAITRVTLGVVFDFLVTYLFMVVDGVTLWELAMPEVVTLTARREVDW